MPYDLQVVEIAYATAKSMGASDKVMLALFEAGIVESGFRNLNYGDRDSLGFLQQRPSQGWGTPTQIMDPAYATRKFVEKANRLGPDRYLTAGQLAQAVQVSAFPLKYDAVAPQASSLLASMGGATSPQTSPVASPIDALNNIRKVIATLTSPDMWLRVGLGAVAVILFIVAVMRLTGNNEIGPTVKKIAKAVAVKKVAT